MRNLTIPVPFVPTLQIRGELTASESERDYPGYPRLNLLSLFLPLFLLTSFPRFSHLAVPNLAVRGKIHFTHLLFASSTREKTAERIEVAGLADPRAKSPTTKRG